MAEKATTFVLKNLLPWLESEIELSGGIHRDVEYMKEELERMRGILQLADATDDVNENMKICIRQMRNVTFDTEDVLEEFMLRLAKDHGDGCLGFVCKMIECLSNFKARHDIASSIKGINRRIEGIYKRIPNDAFSSLDQSSSSSVTARPTWHDPRGDALFLQEAELVGFEKPMETLIQWLLEDKSERGTISVAGIGGLGKTTLVKKVYDDQQVKGHFHCHAWITISQSFEVKRLLKDIIQQLSDESKQQVPNGLDTMNEHKLKELISQFLQQKRYLVVFDDIWSIAAWEDLKYPLPENKCGSRIIVTTRSTDIASYCKGSCGVGCVYDLGPLDREKSWTLFCNKAFVGKSCPPHLEGLAWSILKRCEGLPLAIVAIGGLLKAMKDNTSAIAWEMIYRSLPSELHKNDKLKSLNRVLLLSYSHLPYYLKPCFLYLSIFPEDYMIKSMRLVRLWMAEGFIEEQPRRTLEEVGESYLNELINRSLVQVAKTNIDGRIRRCRVHDLIREIILSKSKDQNVGAMIDKRVTTQLPERIRCLLIHKSCDNVPPTKSLPLLRSLIMMKVHTLSNSKFFGGLRLLKVLDLRSVPLETFPGVVTNLYHLRYLCLKRSKIRTIPDSIERLQNLETLDLKQTYVSELPIGIFKLQKLRHLLVYSYGGGGYLSFNDIPGFKVGREIGKLAMLQKLCYIELDIQCKSYSVIEELGRLSQLRRLAIRKLRREDGKDLCSSIAKMTNLRSLNLGSTEENDVLDLQSLSSPPPFLRTLDMEGRLEKLPDWIPLLSNLVDIRLRWSNLRDDPLEVLEALPNLVQLELIWAYDAESLCFRTGGFQRLKILRFDKLDRLRWVRMEKGTMPLLQKLEIQRCELLERVPFGVEHLVNLNVLQFYDMPDEFIARLHRDGGDHSKISHIPYVYFTFWREGRWHTSTCCGS